MYSSPDEYAYDTAEGIYLLDPVDDISVKGYRPQNCGNEPRTKMPQYGGGCEGCEGLRSCGGSQPCGGRQQCGVPQTCGTMQNRGTMPTCGTTACGRREGFTGGPPGGNNMYAIADVAYNDWPMRFNPNAGPCMANLMPSREQRPYGGGWAPSIYPNQNNPESFDLDYYIARGITGGGTGGGCREAFGNKNTSAFGNKNAETFSANSTDSANSSTNSLLSAEMTVQYIKIFLMIVVIILLAISITVAFQLSQSIKKTLKTAIKVLGDVANMRSK